MIFNKFKKFLENLKISKKIEKKSESIEINNTPINIPKIKQLKK
jgi:hypothetical protein